MMNLAEQWGLRTDGSNPCRHVKKYGEQKRKRYLSRDEMQRLGETLASAQRNKTENEFVLTAVALLALTGPRLTEILKLKWGYVDLVDGKLCLPDSKTGAKEIYLNDAACAILRDIPRLAGNPYVIAGRLEGVRLINLQKPWCRIRAAAGLCEVRIHDLRHSFRQCRGRCWNEFAADRTPAGGVRRNNRRKLSARARLLELDTGRPSLRC
jgi:integrase